MGRIGIEIIILCVISAFIIPNIISAEDPREDDINHPPVAIISHPTLNSAFNSREVIFFDASNCSDPDDDNITFHWVTASKGQISEEATFRIKASDLGWGVEVVTLYVSDGEFTITNATSFLIELHPDDVDTDQDGIPDGLDEDDDNDGLLDVEEDKNKNGLMDSGETDPKNMDTDRDGIGDYHDEFPLDPYPPPTEEEEISIEMWSITIISFVIMIMLISFSKRDHPRDR